MAVPSARNSGLERISKGTPGRWTSSCCLCEYASAREMQVLVKKAMTYSIPNDLSSSARNGTLLNNDSTRLSSNSYILCRTLQRNHVRRSSCTDSSDLCWCIDTQEHDIGLGDKLCNFSREEKVGWPSRKFCSESSVDVDFCGVGSVSSNAYDLVETGFVDGRVLRVPFSDAVDVFVNHCYSDVGVLEGDDCGCWSS